MSPRTAIKAIDLEAWGSRRESQELLPALLRKLVLATGPNLQQVGFPAYERISLPGWDGIVVAGQGDPHVPAGASVWEMGVSENASAKANADYTKRTANPMGVDPAETTFVFVTPRTWPGKGEWAARKVAERQWREVRVYDGVDLEQWLERAPSVLFWMAELLGQRVDDAWDIGTHWRDWATSTLPALTPNLLMAGRSSPAGEIREWLISDRQYLTVAAPSREEALAFFEAVVTSMPADQRDRVQATSLIVASNEAWERLVRDRPPLILIPAVDGLSSGAALRRGHRIVLPADQSVRAEGRAHVVQVNRLSRREAQAELITIGFEESHASELAGLARRNLLALRRRLAVPPGQLRPIWLDDADAARLMPLLLLGTWSGDHEGDCAAAAALAGVSYGDLDALLLRLSLSGDPPARQVGRVWRVVSREEMWEVLSPLLTLGALDQFLDIATAILEQAASGVTSTLEEQFLATMRGERPPYSDALREAVAEGLGFLGTRGAETPRGSARSIADVAVETVVRALNEAARDLNRWASLAPRLADLVEAAPDQVLGAIDEDLRSSHPLLPKLFVDDRNDLFVSSPHTGLLWGLERLAWSPHYLPGAALQMARLARLDPGGRLSNRPSHSLTDLFRSWAPATAATVEQRLDALDLIRKNEPDVAWDLMASLLPKAHDHAMVKPLPKWRDWAPNGHPTVTYGEIRRDMEGLIARVRIDVGPPGHRWEPVIGALGDLPLDLVEQLVGHLEALSLDGVSDDALTAVCESIRSLLSRHRSMEGNSHRLPDEMLNRLSRQLDRLQPGSLPQRHAWVFSWWPEFPDGRGDDIERRDALIKAAQEEAVRALCAGGLDSLLACAALAEAPWMVGAASGALGPLANELDWLGHLSVAAGTSGAFCCGYVAARFKASGWEWAEPLLADAGLRWRPDEVAAVLLCLPNGHTVWEHVARMSPETQAAYWARFRGPGLESPEDCDQAARNLIAHNRPFAAIDLLGLYANGQHKPDLDLMLQALEAALAAGSTEEKHITNMFDYNVELLLDCLTESGTIDEGRLAALEWGWLPLFRFGKRTPSVLHRELRRKPAFFVELVCICYRAEGEEPRVPDNETRRRGEIAYDLLQNWRSPCPQEPEVIPLPQWVEEARQRLEASHRVAVGDLCIGRMLSGSPPGADGHWPHEEVRKVIESMWSADLERGIQMGVFNSRGVVTRDPLSGGGQERAIALRYERNAETLSTRWPRTAAMLRSIGEAYRRDARREDLESESMEDA